MRTQCDVSILFSDGSRIDKPGLKFHYLKSSVSRRLYGVRPLQGGFYVEEPITYLNSEFTYADVPYLGLRGDGFTVPSMQGILGSIGSTNTSPNSSRHYLKMLGGSNKLQWMRPSNIEILASESSINCTERLQFESSPTSLNLTQGSVSFSKSRTDQIQVSSSATYTLRLLGSHIGGELYPGTIFCEFLIYDTRNNNTLADFVPYEIDDEVILINKVKVTSEKLNDLMVNGKSSEYWGMTGMHIITGNVMEIDEP